MSFINGFLYDHSWNFSFKYNNPLYDFEYSSKPISKKIQKGFF